MQKTLIIYDNTGKIWANMTGAYDVPDGLPYLEVEIPEGKYPIKVDLSGETPVMVYAERQKSEELTRIELLEAAINDLLLG